MKIMYIDESGDTLPIENSGKNFLVLPGCIIDEAEIKKLQNSFRENKQKYLREESSLGICIIDPREGQIEKHYIGGELNQVHNKMRWNSDSLWEKCQNMGAIKSRPELL